MSAAEAVEEPQRVHQYAILPLTALALPAEHLRPPGWKFRAVGPSSNRGLQELEVDDVVILTLEYGQGRCRFHVVKELHHAHGCGYLLEPVLRGVTCPVYLERVGSLVLNLDFMAEPFNPRSSRICVTKLSGDTVLLRSFSRSSRMQEVHDAVTRVLELSDLESLRLQYTMAGCNQPVRLPKLMTINKFLASHGPASQQQRVPWMQPSSEPPLKCARR
ncbi:unnamed protein product [Symbiodinium natans]|uniref:Uncharacterized protein n=1 Tax=Symbiodinium natans TaxID=878477 RepID=A0A812S4Y2_9DINO|nr:unnamed protein product [Symbiodinium natans]